MPSVQSPWVFLGAAFVAAAVGIISAAGFFVQERYKQDRLRHGMAQDMARLDLQLSTMKKELDQLKAKQKHKTEKRQKSNKSGNSKSVSVLSTSSDGYTSAADIDSSDEEFYDLTDDEETAPDGSATLDNICSEIDKDLDTGIFSTVKSIIVQLENLCSEYKEADLFWRLGRAYYLAANFVDNTALKMRNIEQGLAACSQALSLNSQSANAHKWYAILIGSRGEYSLLKEKIQDGHVFKEHIDIAIKLNPNDSSLHHLLGRFAFEVAGLKWYERAAASALYAEPPSGTYEEALENFKTAERLAKNDWKENKLFLAKCYIGLGDYKEALCWLDKAAEIIDHLDIDVNEEVRNLLFKYDGYR